ncbi:N-acetylneuraminate synthase family protein [Candidatus Pelagibacter sp.]|nr:N-acetylneuraminate synthase family protein [Candidatus Pelagibacter sp.]
MNKKTIIIAEAGVNHNGRIDYAIKLIDEAANSGADYVKFQHTNPDLISPKARKAKYQITNTKNSENQKTMISKLHLDWDRAYKILLNRCKLKKIKFLTSAFSSNDFLIVNRLKPDFIKIPSGEIVNTELLETISKSNKKILLSTGMANNKEIENALKILTKSNSSKRITLLHCVSEYPTNFKDVNLQSINFLRKKFNIAVGFSDHSLGIEAPIAAVALGATVIEKHFTLSKKMRGPDHKASLDPEELRLMVSKIRNIEKAMGQLKKKPTKNELVTSYLVRQSIHAKTNINKGERFNSKNLCLMRPYDGLPSHNLKKLYNKFSKKKFQKYDPIK